MTTEKLQEILQSNEPLSLEKIKNIIYELKNDCLGQSYSDDLWKSGFYSGEGNAFYICLDLLEKLDLRMVDGEFFREMYKKRMSALFGTTTYTCSYPVEGCIDDE